MVEPKDYAKDADSYTWHKGPLGDWQLLNHEDMLCYVGYNWPKVEKEYGPMRNLTKFERLHIR